MEKIHVFSNGVKVYDKHLIPSQRERYKENNVHEVEEEELFLSVIQSVPDGGCFVNVGAAIGYYCLLAKKTVPDLKVFAFEPLQEHLDYFQQNIILNGFKSEDFCIYPQGVGQSSGRAYFLNHRYGSKIYSQDGTPRNTSEVKNLSSIEVITLNQLVEQVGGYVDLLQMDVQALEAKILRGGVKTLRKQLVNRFIIGTHRENIHNKCIQLLERFSYKVEVDNFATENQADGILCAVATQAL